MDDSLAEIFALRKLGIAMAAMISIIATTIRRFDQRKPSLSVFHMLYPCLPVLTPFLNCEPNPGLRLFST